MFSLLFLTFVAVLGISVLGNMTAIGGGVALVLFFVYYLHLGPSASGGLSLFTIILSTLFGSLSNLRSGLVNMKLFTLIAVPGTAGAFFGAAVVNLLPLDAFKGLFSMIVICIGLYSLSATARLIRETRGQKVVLERDEVTRRCLVRLVLFVAGAVSGLIGIGIGGIAGTFLTANENLRARTAFSTIFLGTIPITLVGALVHFSSFALSWTIGLYLLPITFGTLAGATIGSSLLKRTPSTRSRFLQGYTITSFGLLSLALFLVTTHVI